MRIVSPYSVPLFSPMLLPCSSGTDAVPSPGPRIGTVSPYWTESRYCVPRLVRSGYGASLGEVLSKENENMIRSALLPALLTAVLAVFVAVPFVAAAEFETPPVLRAADLVAEELLEGPHYKVDPEVQNDGYMNHYEIHSDFGDFQARSGLILEMRIKEVYALAKLAEMSKTDAFVDALGAAGAGMVDAAANVVTDPVGTVKGLGAGINRTFKGYKYKGKKAKHKGGDMVDDYQEDKHSDDGEAAGEGDATGEEGADSEEEKASTTEKAGDAALNILGWDKTKRQLSQSLEVDPYTDNEVLQKELDRVAKAAFAANLGVRFGVPGIPGMSYVNKANQMVWTLPPIEIERLNDLALKEAGVENAIRLDFFANSHWSPTLETVFVQSLAGMDTTEGRQAAVEVAVRSDSKLTSYIFSLTARVLYAHHVLVEPIAEIRALGDDESGRVVVGISESGKLIVPLAFDYLIWRDELAKGGPAYEFDQREVFTAGRMSETCREQLEERGWKVHTQVLVPWQKELEAKEAEAAAAAAAAAEEDS